MQPISHSTSSQRLVGIRNESIEATAVAERVVVHRFGTAALLSRMRSKPLSQIRTVSLVHVASSSFDPHERYSVWHNGMCYSQTMKRYLHDESPDQGALASIASLELCVRSYRRSHQACGVK